MTAIVVQVLLGAFLIFVTPYLFRINKTYGGGFGPSITVRWGTPLGIVTLLGGLTLLLHAAHIF